MTKELKRKLIETGIGIVLYIYALFAVRHWPGMDLYQQLALYLLSYLVVITEVLRDIAIHLKEKRYFDENLLIVLATIGAFLIGMFAEASGVLLFFEIGKILEILAMERSKMTIARFMDIRPDYANRKVDGEPVVVNPKELKLRQIIIIKPGEKIPVDAVVTLGTSNINTMALTGESVPRYVKPGDKLYSGSINMTGVLEARVTKLYGESTASKILDLVQNARNRQSERESFVARFTRWYTPIVTLLAFAVMLIPTVVLKSHDLHTWVYRGMIFLVTACPCGLMVSVPLAFFGGIGAASRQGVLIKGSNYLEALVTTETFIFDKTGTLTEGVFRVKEYHPIGISREEMLEVMACGESHSNHPIANSLKEAYGKDIDNKRLKWAKEFPGYGVQANVDGKKVLIGNAKFMKQRLIEYKRVYTSETAVHIAIEDKYAGYVLISDTIRPDVRKTVERLKRYQADVVMLTGDNERVAKAVAKKLGIESVFANLLPEEKVEQLHEYMDSRLESENVAFVGDGINDAPVLAMADIGIAMGGLGSDAAIQAADVVLMEDEPHKIITAVRISKSTIRTVRQNMIYAIGIKVILLVYATIGFVTMREAILIDMAVLLINLLNSLWVMRYPEK
ncbi:MAG: heavy metal translocating P-type ATPase [Hespellia sp.]|nr:heavy metal translocating P-type ATPase [Hespellia sp.]